MNQQIIGPVVSEVYSSWGTKDNGLEIWEVVVRDLVAWNTGYGNIAIIANEREWPMSLKMLAEGEKVEVSFDIIRVNNEASWEER